MEKEQCTKYAVNAANEIELEIDTPHKRSKKAKKKRSRKTHEKTISSRSRSNSLRRHSLSSGHGCAETSHASSSHKIHHPTSEHLVQYSDVSSTDFSDPEAGEINSDASIGKRCAVTVIKKRHNIVTNKILNKPATLKPDARSDINISSDEENYR